MRTFVGYLLVMTSSFLTAQTSQELHSRYGEPDRERFSPRPEIALTAEYGTDGLVCRVLVEPSRPLFVEPNQDVFMPPDLVTEILEEVATLASRGSETGSFSTITGCNDLHTADYTNVSIMRSTRNCRDMKPEREMEAMVSFKRDASQGQHK
jgi:hypothetical protein